MHSGEEVSNHTGQVWGPTELWSSVSAGQKGAKAAPM